MLRVVILLLVVFVVTFALVARAAADEARSQVCYLTCTP